MTRFEDRLTDELGLMAGPEPSVDALAVARSIAAQAPKRRFTPMFTALKFVLAAALLALTGGLLAAGALQLFDDSELALDSETPIPDYAFEKSPIGPVDSGTAGILQLANGNLVVTGGDRDGANLVWSTTDGGATWSQASREVGFEDIATLDDRVVAIGEGQETASGLLVADQIWSSADGLAWEPIATIENAHVERLQASPDGLVALGWDHRPDGSSEHPRGYPTIWTSSDGASWTANEIGQPLPVSELWPGDCCWAHFFRDPVRADDGTWLVAADYMNDSPGIERVIFWRSLDGVDWEVAWDPEGEFGLGTLAGTPSGFVATISSADKSSGDWVTRTVTSSDGLDWQAVGDPEGSESGSGGTLVDGSAGPMLFQFEGVFETEGEDGPEYPALADTGPIDVPLHRFVEGEGWVVSESGIDNALITDGIVTPDGRLLLVGLDFEACESAACIWEEGGFRPTLWIGTPE